MTTPKFGGVGGAADVEYPVVEFDPVDDFVEERVTTSDSEVSSKNPLATASLSRSVFSEALETLRTLPRLELLEQLGRLILMVVELSKLLRCVGVVGVVARCRV